MDSWPANVETKSPAAIRRRKREIRNYTPSDNFLSITPGSANAVTLYDFQGRLKWTSVLNDTPQARPALDATITIFPSTRIPVPEMPHLSIRQRTEQGAHFIRTHLPDVDIPFELLRDEITEDTSTYLKIRNFNPYVGRLLQPIISRNSAFVAFPMGPLDRDLNISPLSLNEDEELTFKPTPSPVASFPTPIQDITTSRTCPSSDSFGTLVLVRTYGSVSIFEFVEENGSYQPSVISLAQVRPEHVRGQTILSTDISSLSREALMLTDKGELYRVHIDHGADSLRNIYACNEEVVEANQDLFWRVVMHDQDPQCVIASNNRLLSIDLRTDSATNSFVLSNVRDLITSVQYSGTCNHVQLSTTREIIWLDKRNLSKALIGCQHGRKYDRSLELHALLSKPDLTFLTSRKNSLITLYDVSYGSGNLIHLNGMPQSLSPSSCQLRDQAFFATSPNETLTASTIDLFSLTTHSALLHTGIHMKPSSKRRIFRPNWSSEIQDLETNCKMLTPDVGPSGDKDFAEVDFSATYEDLYVVPARAEEDDEEARKEEVYHVIEKIPLFWQELNPSTNMLTMYDVVFRSGKEPKQASRADFLTGSAISSARGFRALSQGRITEQQLKQGAQWYYDLSPQLQRLLGPSFSSNVVILAENLKKHDLMVDPKRTPRSLQQEKSARRQLAMDLALSSHIFYSQGFTSDGLENLTKTLSLNNEPPSIMFRYLRPASKSDDAQEERAEPNISPGVRALLQDWVVGSKLGEYEPGGDESGDELLKRSPVKTRSRVPQNGRRPFFGSHSQQPPVIASSTPLLVQSQDTMRQPPKLAHHGSQFVDRALAFPEATQTQMANTQILPGPFGGRNVFSKKRATKKRVGGF